jgi:hypothetical protein
MSILKPVAKELLEQLTNRETRIQVPMLIY